MNLNDINLYYYFLIVVFLLSVLIFIFIVILTLKQLIASKLLNTIRKKFSCDIDKRYIDSVYFAHPVGVVFYPESCGCGCMVWQNVTVGLKDKFKNGSPRIGNNVTIYAGSIIIGSINIRDGAIIGAGAIVLKDVPEGAIIKGVWK